MADERDTLRADELHYERMLRAINAGRMNRRQVLHRGLALGLSIPALSALLAACGGDDDDDDGGETTDGGSTDEPTATAAESSGGDGEATEAEGEETEGGDEPTEEESGGGEAASSGTLTLIQTGSVPDLDPQSAYDSDASAIFFGAYEMLLRLAGESTFEYEPMLAESWESNEDLTEWTFTIPEGVMFHDGTPCDAAAVAASLQRFHQMGLGPVNVITRFVATPEDITAPDATTLVFKLSYGTDIFLAALASQYGPLIVSPAAVEENATDDDPFAHEWFRENVVGTGPYKLKEHVLGQHIILDRFQEFHGGWDGNHFDEIVFRNVEESATRRQLVESGEADALTQTLPPEDVVAIEEAGELAVTRYDTTNANWIAFNYVKLPDANVRKAMAWAFPYEEVRNDVYQGLVIESSGACTPTTIGYPEDGFIYTTDLEMAKQLLDDAGFDYGQALEFMISSGDTEERATAQLYQANLQSIGVTLDIVEMEEGAQTDLMYGSAPAEERPHFVSWGWWPDYNDAWNEIYPNFHTDAIAPNGSNALYYSNAQVDELLDASSELAAGDEYNQTIADINRIMVEEDPAAAFYGSLQWFTVMNPAIKGFIPNPIYINTYNIYDMYREE